MKQFKLTAAVLLIATVIIVGCNKKGEVTKPSAAQAVDKTTESAKMMDYMVTKWGYKKEDIKEMSDGFLIQGDMIIPKRNFWTGYAVAADPASRFYRSKYLVTAANVIYVDFDPSVPTEWRTAYTNAMSKWNALNGRIYFTTGSSAHGVWIDYKSFGPSYTTAFAGTTLPSWDGYAGYSSTINSTCTIALSATEKLYTAAHELGHALGFGHTDSAEADMDNPITVSLYCDYTPNLYSVMRQGKKSFSDFSGCDKDAFKVLYPR